MIKNVVVVGGGFMGSGIAETIVAHNNYKVTLVEVNEQLAKNAVEKIRKNLQRLAQKKFKNDKAKELDFFGKINANLVYTSNVREAVRNADFVCEAIVEKLTEKQELFKLIESVAPVHTIFTTNTSSLSVNEIAAQMNCRNRFGALHFFFPPPIMRLVEIIRVTETSDETYDQIKQFAESIGKTTISCKDTPGFVVNRMLTPYINSAIQLFNEGIASARDIDIAMKLGAGHPMGPLELADNVGLDVCLFVATNLHKRDPNCVGPSDLLQQMVREGKLGVKCGEGFYNYKK